MGSQTIQVPVKLVSAADEHRHSRGEVTLQEWDAGDRTRRALKTLGFLWAAALGSVLIPLAHFVLVPGLFLAGPIAAYWIYQNERMIVGGSASCPNCGKPFAIARSKVRWPLNDLCAECQMPARIYSLQNP